MTKALFLLLALVLSLPGLRAQDEIITATDTWDWLHPTDAADPAVMDADFGSTWHSYIGYDGPAFTSGVAPFAYGTITYFTDNQLVAADLGTPASGNRFSAYFKKQINLPGDRANVILQLVADDGAIIYIDGVEIRRVNVSGTVADTPDTYMLMADGAVNEAVLTTVNLGSLAAGDHVIAVSLHNADTASSDLGFYFRLLGTTPAVQLLQTDFAGVLTPVLSESGYSGWNPDAFDGDIRANGAEAMVLHTISSVPVDLTAAGDCFFSIQFYAHEISATSNFETADQFSARLEVTFDDDTTGEIGLIPPALDADANGVLNGNDGGINDEFNSQLAPVAGQAMMSTQFEAPVPANVKSARLVVSWINSSASTSETIAFGGALISDKSPGTDSDLDASPDNVELFAGTDPLDAGSVFRANDVTLGTTAGGNRQLTIRFPSGEGKRYAIEQTADGVTWDLFNYATSPAANPDIALNLDLGASSLTDTKRIIRLRPVP